ncbi:uncharacterized protein TM35_000132840 [Trypanosoma theileri]|uniref:Uncharacterized protein n=1 Tax=Trypanosoma theileri TaxID=67003 RepID=A0A1X0NYP9_9TRYP|nr:uncharacterized protein TM35_000132840 [Trypanosoma theileri]ORC89280.1 hypothetical protein TM35_000132840 [Trypanosoma theileri]
MWSVPPYSTTLNSTSRTAVEWKNNYMRHRPPKQGTTTDPSAVSKNLQRVTGTNSRLLTFLFLGYQTLAPHQDDRLHKGYLFINNDVNICLGNIQLIIAPALTRTAFSRCGDHYLFVFTLCFLWRYSALCSLVTPMIFDPISLLITKPNKAKERHKEKHF